MSEVQSDSHASSDDDDDVAAEQQDQNKDHEEDEEEAEDAEDDEQQQQEIQQEDMDDALQDPHQPSDGPPSHVADHMQRVPIVKGPAHVLIEQGNAFYRQSELRAALNLYVRAAELVRRSQKEMHVLLAALLNAGETLLQLGDGEGPGFSFLQEAMTMIDRQPTQRMQDACKSLCVPDALLWYPAVAPLEPKKARKPKKKGKKKLASKKKGTVKKR